MAMKQVWDASYLAHVVREKRVMLALTVRDAAASIGTSETTLLRVEQGEGIELATALKVTDWLELPVQAFVRRQKA